jgi:hypothetical protein
MALNKIYIPTFIADDKFNPSNVLPRFFFYNGIKQVNPFRIQYRNGTGPTSATSTISSEEFFPYFDHYNTGSSASNNPTTDSDSLLFFNETPAYGITPTQTLYSKYWENYISLLYDPRTRLINASANIPLAEYFDIELNDIIEFRSNYYHLRAINDYNLVTGECKIQLLGPILEDAMDEIMKQAVIDGSIPTN